MLKKRQGHELSDWALWKEFKTNCPLTLVEIEVQRNLRTDYTLSKYCRNKADMKQRKKSQAAGEIWEYKTK